MWGRKSSRDGGSDWRGVGADVMYFKNTREAKKQEGKVRPAVYFTELSQGDGKAIEFKKGSWTYLYNGFA